jgi:hypothetical protein
MRVLACLLSTLLLAPVLLGASAAAQIPRDRDGRPDISGVWAAGFLTRLERPSGVNGLAVSPEQASVVERRLTRRPSGVYDPDIDWYPPEGLLNVGGELRSSWLTEPADGRMPYTAQAKAAIERADTLSEHGFDNPEERPTSERCVSGFGHAPVTAVSLVIPSQIIVAPDAVLVMTEDTDMGRIIRMGAAAPPNAVRSRAGWSVGRWEGDVLVVETTHLSTAGDPPGVLFRDAILVTEASRVIERFWLAGPDTLAYAFTVEDPALYERPWRAEIVLQRRSDRVYEYVCHEGNRGMVNALMAARLGRQEKPEPSSH